MSDPDQEAVRQLEENLRQVVAGEIAHQRVDDVGIEAKRAL